MHYGIILLSIVPFRKEPANQSEMVSQLLFGETYEVLNSTEEWLQIRNETDAYIGWINVKQHNVLSAEAFKKIKESPPYVNGDLVQIIKNKITGNNLAITIGAHLPLLNKNEMQFDNQHFIFEGSAISKTTKNGPDKIIQSAYLLLNAPYLWGGKSPFGIDCSGFTQLVFSLNGYQLPRDASQQVELGEALSFVEESQTADLAFFDNEEGAITHVGILLDNQHIIHASGQVRIDKFDHYGIFHSERKKYSHHLRVIKRII